MTTEIDPFLLKLYAVAYNKSEPITLAQEREAHRAGMLAVARVIWDEGFEAGEQAGLMPSMYGDTVNPYDGDSDDQG